MSDIATFYAVGAHEVAMAEIDIQKSTVVSHWIRFGISPPNELLTETNFVRFVANLKDIEFLKMHDPTESSPFEKQVKLALDIVF